MSTRVEALSRRVHGDSFFLASALADYLRSERLDEQGLAAVLGCPLETLVPLRLCRRPRPDAPGFRSEIERIAECLGLKSDALAEVVRRSDSLAALRDATATGLGVLMAARDHHNGGDDTSGPR